MNLCIKITTKITNAHNTHENNSKFQITLLPSKTSGAIQAALPLLLVM